jgi:hypothetical protein
MTIWRRWGQTTLANKLLIIVGASAAVFTAGQLWILVQGADHAEAERIDNFRPVVVFDVAGQYKLGIKNIGKGPALDIELRLSQVHPSGGLTNLRNMIDGDAERNLLNLGESDRIELGGSDTIRAYAFAQEPDYRWGERDVFAAIGTYADINRRPYYTLSLVRTFPNGSERSLVMKSTKTAYYGSGNIEKLNIIDWMK